MDTLTVYGNALRRLLDKINATPDLKPVRRLQWFRDTLDLLNWFDVSSEPLSEFTKVCVIEPIMDRVRDCKVAPKSVRLSTFVYLGYLSDGY